MDSGMSEAAFNHAIVVSLRIGIGVSVVTLIWSLAKLAGLL